jgi:hypothetical protein
VVTAVPLAHRRREQIPAGMPTDLLQQTILVYSDLAARRAAMASFGDAHDVPEAPITFEATPANGGWDVRLDVC